MGRRKNLPLLEEVTIENIGAEGKSIARVDGMVVFVKEAVPGDVVDLQVFRKKGQVHGGTGSQVPQLFASREPSPFVSTSEFAGDANGNTFPMIDSCTTRSNRWWMPSDILPEWKYLKQCPSWLLIPSPSTGTNWNTPSPITAGCWTMRQRQELPLEHTNAVGLHVPGRFDKVVDIHTCHLQGEPTNARAELSQGDCPGKETHFL